jgi:site-specific recombinase
MLKIFSILTESHPLFRQKETLTITVESPGLRMYRIKSLGTINMHSGLQIALLVGFWLWFSGAFAAGAACEQVHIDDVTI